MTPSKPKSDKRWNAGGCPLQARYRLKWAKQLSAASGRPPVRTSRACSHSFSLSAHLASISSALASIATVAPSSAAEPESDASLANLTGGQSPAPLMHAHDVTAAKFDATAAVPQLNCDESISLLSVSIGQPTRTKPGTGPERSDWGIGGRGSRAGTLRGSRFPVQASGGRRVTLRLPAQREPHILPGAVPAQNPRHARGLPGPPQLPHPAIHLIVFRHPRHTEA